MALIFLGSDHAGFNLRQRIRDHLQQQGHSVQDEGTYSTESCDYPVFAQKVCDKVLENEGSFGILVCGTGIGMSMAANRVKGIRAALCTSEFQARAARQHNNANILCLGERVTGFGVALGIADAFFATSFEGGRHQRRINLFDK